MPVDDSKSITITVVNVVATAKITSFQIVVRPQLGGADITYDILAGNLPKAAAGDTIFVHANIINNGGDGNCFISVVQGNTILWEGTYFVYAGHTGGVAFEALASANPFTMPNMNKQVIVYAGHP